MSKRFEILVEEWGETNTIQYWVTGYGNIVKNTFHNEKELVAILKGVANDYMSATSPPTVDTPNTVEGWQKLLAELAKKGKENE